MKRILLHPELSSDLKLCKKKRWFPGLEDQLVYVYRLLATKEALPGEYPIFGMGEEYTNSIKHAGINLPKLPFGKRKGPRIVYTLRKDAFLVLYVGGHQDKRYNVELVALLKERLSMPNTYLEWIDEEE